MGKNSTKGRCASCRWFDYARNKRGLCRVNPPNDKGQWPRVKKTDFCSQHATVKADKR